MTVSADIKAITPTATAKAALSKGGTDINALFSQTLLVSAELRKLLLQIQALHPSGGGDAANYAALTTIINELA